MVEKNALELVQGRKYNELMEPVQAKPVGLAERVD